MKEFLDSRSERITPKYITSLKEGEVFVFGSNLAGIHGAGAAKLALKWGAIFGKGIGIYGSTYAIPTKDHTITTLPLNRIQQYVEEFCEFADTFDKKKYLVTEIGCGLAGYRPVQIAPFFQEAVKLQNVSLPTSFWKVLL